MSAIKILHVIDSLGHGGAEHQLSLTVKSFDRTRYQSFVCYLHQPEFILPQIESAGVPAYGLDLPRGKASLMKAVSKVSKLVRSLEIDVVHTSLFESDIVGVLVGKITGVPVVGTLCNVGGEPERLLDNPEGNRLKLNLTTSFWGLMLRLGHRHNIAISQAVKASAIKTYGLSESRLSVIYRALPDSWFGEVPPAEVDTLKAGLGVDDKYPVLLNVGRLVPQKGQVYLIEAMPEVLKHCPDAHLLLVGEGPLREDLTNLSKKLGIDGHVSFLGRREDVKNLLTISDIFVFPSLYEGLGVSLLEAAGTGRPCVATRVGPVPEVIEDGVSGLLTDSQDARAVADAIVRLASDQERAREMGARAKMEAQRKFGALQMARQVGAVYERVLPQARRIAQIGQDNL